MSAAMASPNLRRTLAVVFCDLAGTTRLMTEAGDLAVANLLQAFFENTNHLAKEHHCLMIKPISDGFIAAFENVGDVLPFAMAVQRLAETEPSMRGRHISFRFSLHCGDVLYIDTSYGTDVFGDAVNLAARLNDLAQPGQIVISDAAREQMPPGQQTMAGTVETGHIKSGDVQIYRASLG
jgi:class 3 adenylate cyclase